MTVFEQQVADVVCELLHEAKCPDGFPEANMWERATHLAPRIVAALIATAVSVAKGESFGVPEKRALAAMRGTDMSEEQS